MAPYPPPPDLNEDIGIQHDYFPTQYNLTSIEIVWGTGSRPTGKNSTSHDTIPRFVPTKEKHFLDPSSRKRSHSSIPTTTKKVDEITLQSTPPTSTTFPPQLHALSRSPAPRFQTPTAVSPRTPIKRPNSSPSSPTLAPSSNRHKRIKSDELINIMGSLFATAGPQGNTNINQTATSISETSLPRPSPSSMSTAQTTGQGRARSRRDEPNHPLAPQSI